MSCPSFVAGSTRDELQQQLNDARQTERKAEAAFLQALCHLGRLKADQSQDEFPMETELENEQYPTLEESELELASITVCYLEEKVHIKFCEEKYNENRHQLDHARIECYVDQLQHQARLEKAGNKLHGYEAKIAAGNESYVVRKTLGERQIRWYIGFAQQHADHLQRRVENWEDSGRTIKGIMAACERSVASNEQLLRLREEVVAKARILEKGKAKRQRLAEANERLDGLPLWSRRPNGDI